MIFGAWVSGGSDRFPLDSLAGWFGHYSCLQICHVGPSALLKMLCATSWFSKCFLIFLKAARVDSVVCDQEHNLIPVEMMEFGDRPGVRQRVKSRMTPRILSWGPRWIVVLLIMLGNDGGWMEGIVSSASMLSLNFLLDLWVRDSKLYGSGYPWESLKQIVDWLLLFSPSVVSDSLWPHGL